MSEKIFIIIVTYNGMEWLPKCLASTKPYPVIIVDNNSTDGTFSFVEKNYPEVVLFKQKNNLGFGQANNIGISYALKEGADYVFLLNQDAYLKEGCLEKLLAIHQKNLDFGVLSPIHLNGSGNLLDENFSYYLSYRNNRYFFSDFVLGNDKKNIYKVPFVNAAGWLLSRKCLESVGGFDPIFFHYGEDVNYCYRVWYHGFKVGVVSNVFLRHDREERKSIDIRKGSPEYWQDKARSLKIKFSNINENCLINLETSLRNRRLSFYKAYFKVNFRAAAQYKMEIKMLKEIIPEIKRSRLVNKQTGTNYLSI